MLEGCRGLCPPVPGRSPGFERHALGMHELPAPCRGVQQLWAPTRCDGGPFPGAGLCSPVRKPLVPDSSSAPGAAWGGELHPDPSCGGTMAVPSLVGVEERGTSTRSCAPMGTCPRFPVAFRFPRPLQRFQPGEPQHPQSLAQLTAWTCGFPSPEPLFWRGSPALLLSGAGSEAQPWAGVCSPPPSTRCCAGAAQAMPQGAEDTGPLWTCCLCCHVAPSRRLGIVPAPRVPEVLSGCRPCLSCPLMSLGRCCTAPRAAAAPVPVLGTRAGCVPSAPLPVPPPSARGRRRGAAGASLTY